MNILEIIKNPVVKKSFGVVSAVVSGVLTISSALTEQKKAQEFEDMKKTVSELKKTMGS